MNKVGGSLNDDLYIKDCGSYNTVINLNGNYKSHCHIDNRKSAELFKKQVERKIVPRGKYFRSCALRVTIQEGYIEKILVKIDKDKNRTWYRNINKGLQK